MLLTLVTHWKNGLIAFGAAKNKAVEQKPIRVQERQSLMVTDSALKLDYASMAFADPKV